MHVNLLKIHTPIPRDNFSKNKSKSSKNSYYLLELSLFNRKTILLVLHISWSMSMCVCVCVSLVFTYRVRSCALWTVPDNASFPGPWTMPLTTATTYNNHDDDTDTDCITTLNNNGTVVEREWTSPGYGNEGAPRCTAEPPCSEPLLPTGEQLQCKGISGQQLESPRGRLEISFECRGEKLPCQCPEHEISNRLKAMVEHKRVRL